MGTKNSVVFRVAAVLGRVERGIICRFGRWASGGSILCLGLAGELRLKSPESIGFGSAVTGMKRGGGNC